MSSTLLTALSSPLKVLAETSPVGIAEVPAKVEAIWQEAWSSRPHKEGEAVNDKDVETARAVLEVVSRELTVLPLSEGALLEPPTSSLVEEKQAFQEALQYRLDIALALFESAYASINLLETGAMFLPLLEELVELVSVESWRELWGYVETRSKRFTKDMPASKGKALPLLRTINAFLRFLPRTPEDLVFRGRVHQFASSVISIADKSAINMRGDYNEIKTIWDEPEPEVAEDVKDDALAADAEATETEADGDVKMDSETRPDEQAKPEKEQPSAGDNDKKDPEAEFYSTLWSLQQYFAHPPSLAPQPGTSATASGAPFAAFKQKSDFVLPILFEQTKKQKELMGREAETGQAGNKKRKRNGESGGDEGAGFFHPRYLTGKRLLEHELADPSFRRQILVQYFILFQFLLHLTPSTASKQAFMGGMPKNFVIEAEDESWVKGKVSEIREELRKMPGDGVRFEKTVLSIITREFHYATWKNEGCPEGVFEIPPLDKGSAEERAHLWKRRLAPPRRFRFAVGTMSLSDMWRGGYTDIDQLRNWKRKSDVPSLYEEIKSIDADEEDDKAMGDVPAATLSQNDDRRTSLTWRALRLHTHTDIRKLAILKEKRDLHTLFNPPPPKSAAPVKNEHADVKQDQSQVQGAGETPAQADAAPDVKAEDEAEAGAEAGAEEQQESEVIADVAESEDTATATATANAEDEPNTVTAAAQINGPSDGISPNQTAAEEPIVKTPELVETDLPAETATEVPEIAESAIESASAGTMDIDKAVEAPTTPELEPTAAVETPALDAPMDDETKDEA